MADSSFVPRINQIDAVELDKEIYRVIKSQAEEISKYFTPGVIAKWQPELDFLIKYLIWSYSLKTSNSSFGQQLLNLSYRNLNHQKAVLLFVLSTVPYYLRERLLNENFILSRLPSSYERSRYKGHIERIDNFIHLLNFIWSFFFLHLGNQPRFVERLLGIHNQSMQINRPRSIGYSYMTRELMWHGLIEMFTISLPMIDFRRIQKMWNSLWLPRKKEKNIVIKCRLELNATCAYCNQKPILPRWAGCPHVFCYYCLEALFMMTDPYRCAICGEELYSIDLVAHLNV
ncbi:hypothetical protein QAD02_016651 [Eretmocerus hayati]|uniref:Uncharacterized protein n=1 Tax=Eretmocerus hayati TaxID=131215 RepID=A0ACC2PC47_9HYME|nr:hypothetical protein QAD02_016651 [Eretmocerus hayati]